MEHDVLDFFSTDEEPAVGPVLAVPTSEKSRLQDALLWFGTDDADPKLTKDVDPKLTRNVDSKVLASPAVRKPHMLGLHGTGKQHRSNEWMVAMRACKTKRGEETIRTKACELDDDFNKSATKYGSRNKVQRTMGFEDKPVGTFHTAHSNWIMPSGGVLIANCIGASNMNFAIAVAATHLHKSIVMRNARRVGYIVLKLMTLVILSAVDLLEARKTSGHRNWFSTSIHPESYIEGSLFCESFLWDEAEQVVRPRLGHATHANVLSMDGAFMLFDGTRTSLLERALHPNIIVAGNINAEATLAVLNRYPIAASYRDKLSAVEWVLRLFISDEASYNKKALAYAKIGIDDRFVKLQSELVVSLFCLTHRLCRTRSAMMSYFDLVAPIFALVNLFNVTSNRDALRRNIATYVRAKLRRCAPAVDNRARNFRNWILSLVLLAWAADGNSGLDPHKSPGIQRLLLLATLLNGDWRVDGAVIHHCFGEGCCTSDEDCADKIIAAINDIFVDRAWPRPSFKSWTNCLSSFALFFFFYALHRLLLHCGPHLEEVDTARKAAQVSESRAGLNSDGDHWHEKQKTRKKRVGVFLNTPGIHNDMIIVLASLISQIELHCILRKCDSDENWLHRLAVAKRCCDTEPDWEDNIREADLTDERFVILDLVNLEHSPIKKASKRLTAMLDSRVVAKDLSEFRLHRIFDETTTDWTESSDAAVSIIQYYCGLQVGVDDYEWSTSLIISLRIAVIPVTAQMWQKTLMYECCPLTLARLVDSRITMEQKM